MKGYGVNKSLDSFTYKSGHKKRSNASRSANLRQRKKRARQEGKLIIRNTS